MELCVYGVVDDLVAASEKGAGVEGRFEAVLRWESVLEDTGRQSDGQSVESWLWVEGLFQEYCCRWDVERVES